LRRKFREIAGAMLLNACFDKRELAVAYLARAYFGTGMHGVTEASARLGFDLKAIQPHQAAEIVACLKYPLPSEVSDMRRDAIRRRATHIELRMLTHRT